jgi:hypothetical protein
VRRALCVVYEFSIGICWAIGRRLHGWTNLVPAYWSHLGDVLSAVGVIAFTLASLLIVDIGLNWRELTTRRD